MIVDGLLTALQDSSLAQALRASIWVYPLVNAGHIVGLALLFGAIVPLDLRLLGAWRQQPLLPLVAMLVPIAVAGVLLAVVTGALLFAARPLEYAAEPLFLVKMGLVTLALLNAIVLHRVPSWRRAMAAAADGADRSTPRHWTCAAALSIGLWLTVIVLGRLIGYR